MEDASLPVDPVTSPTEVAEVLAELAQADDEEIGEEPLEVLALVSPVRES